jgi:hypothetical protein
MPVVVCVPADREMTHSILVLVTVTRWQIIRTTGTISNPNDGVGLGPLCSDISKGFTDHMIYVIDKTAVPMVPSRASPDLRNDNLNGVVLNQLLIF